MPRKSTPRKIELRVFLEETIVKHIDKLIEAGIFGTRSEAVRDIVNEWAKKRLRRPDERVR